MSDTEQQQLATQAPQKALLDKEKHVANVFIQVGPVQNRVVQVAEKTGYRRESVYKILKKPHVLAYVREREAEIQSSIKAMQLLNREWIIGQLIEVHKQCMKGEPVLQYDPVEKAMVPTGEWAFDSRGANRALELLGKEIGMFEKKPQTDDRKIFNVQINLNKYHEEGAVVEYKSPALPFQGGINGKTTG